MSKRNLPYHASKRETGTHLNPFSLSQQTSILQTPAMAVSSLSLSAGLAPPAVLHPKRDLLHGAAKSSGCKMGYTGWGLIATCTGTFQVVPQLLSLKGNLSSKLWTWHRLGLPKPPLFGFFSGGECAGQCLCWWIAWHCGSKVQEIQNPAAVNIGESPLLPVPNMLPNRAAVCPWLFHWAKLSLKNFFLFNLSGYHHSRDVGLDLPTGKHQTKKTVVRLHVINGLQLKFFFSFVPADLTESYKNI